MGCQYDNQSYNRNNDKNKGCDNEILVGNTLFNYSLNEEEDCVYSLVATPCNVPTSVYCIARITTRENCCNNMEYYQSFINTDPVEIIQDCNLKQIIRRSIEAYFDNNSSFFSNNGCNRRCSSIF